MKIYDNFLDKDSHLKIENTFLKADKFPWYYYNCVVDPGTNLLKGSLNFDYQFYHIFYEQHQITSNYYNILTPLLLKIKPLGIIRIKSNLLPSTHEQVIYGWHVDIKTMYNEMYDSLKHKTAIYYVNSNNGKTIFEDGTEIESVANRLVVFNGNIKHTGTTCTDEKVRCVINFNFIEI